MSANSRTKTATEHREAFYADLACGVATMDAACAWIRAAFDERLRADMLKERNHDRPHQ